MKINRQVIQSTVGFLCILLLLAPITVQAHSMIRARLVKWTVILFLASIALSSTLVWAFYPPLQDIQSWVEGANTHFKIYDPNLGVDKEFVCEGWSPVVFNGILAWQGVGSLQMAVYDPLRESWMAFTHKGTGGPVLIADGIVRNGKRFIFTYNPQDGEWKALDFLRADDFAANAGVFAAVRYAVFKEEYTVVEYYTYDFSVNSWAKGDFWVGYEGNNITELSIDDEGTVSWVWHGSLYRRGYNRGTHTWYDGPTLPLASFAAPSLTNSNGNTCFTDTSLGATSWHYDFGDGTTSDLRSPFHTYDTPGEYLVTQTVTSSEGSHTATRTVVVKNLYTITASKEGNGTISPPGVTSVWEGSSMSFKMTPDPGYFISGVTVDGKPIGVGKKYFTFSDVTADHTISVSFGINLESFETGNFHSNPWKSSGYGAWIVQDTMAYDGTYAAQAPTSLEGNQWSSLSVRLRVEWAMVISFWIKVSSEQNSDFLIFTIDGVEQGRWSGEVGWADIYHPVTPGEHTFTWTYSKDAEVSKGSDTAWIDMIMLPRAQPRPGDDDHDQGDFYFVPSKKGGVAVIYLQ